MSLPQLDDPIARMQTIMLAGQVELGKATKHVDNSASKRALESLQKKVPDPVTKNIVFIH